MSIPTSIDLFPDEPPRDTALENRMNNLAKRLIAEGKKVDSIILTFFSDPELFYNLPEPMQTDEILLGEYIVNSSRFFSILSGELRKGTTEEGLFGEYVTAPERISKDGRISGGERERSINIDYLKKIGIDPARVLVFRGTNKFDDTNKNEYYWTSDYWEVVTGLSVETTNEMMRRRVILVSDLQTIYGRDGLIMDKNDGSNGISVRRLGTGTFSHTDALCVFRHSRFDRRLSE